jgi:hypothetical protein
MSVQIPPELIAEALGKALADYLQTRSLFDPEFIRELARAVAQEQEYMKREEAARQAAERQREALIRLQQQAMNVGSMDPSNMGKQLDVLTKMFGSFGY